MLRRLAVAVGLVLSVSAIGRAQTADEIVEKTIAAQHLDKLKTVQTIRTTATMSITPPGIDMAAVIEQKRPMKMRATFTFQGVDNIQAYDGETGWSLMPLQQQTKPEAVNAEILKDLQQQADLDTPLVDYKAKGHKIELLGKEPVQGTDAYKLRLTLKDGDVQYHYIDAAKFLPIKMETTRTINGAESKVESFTSDYKDEGGVLVAHLIEQTIPVQGTTMTQKVTITKVEYNVPIDDARFKMPAAK